MQRTIGHILTFAAAVTVLTVLYNLPVAAENWVEAGKSKLGGQDFPFCIDVDGIRSEPNGWSSSIAAPCDPAWRKMLASAANRRAVRCDRPISASATYMEFLSTKWSEERPMGVGVAELAKFACQRK